MPAPVLNLCYYAPDFRGLNMSKRSENPDDFTLQVNKDKLFSDVLKYVLKKTLSDDCVPLIQELETAFYERWAALEAGDEKKSESLEQVERKLVDKLLTMGTQKR